MTTAPAVTPGPVIKKEVLALKVEDQPVLNVIDPSIDPDVLQQGRGSWYGGEFHRRRTANGERFDMYGFTAAHRTLPFGTIVRVTDEITRKSVLVCINDRGPFIRNKVLDLSKNAASTLGGTLRNLKLEAFLPGRALLAYNNEEHSADGFVVGFGIDRQLKAIKSTKTTPWSYETNFTEALHEQRMLALRYPDCEVLISSVESAEKGVKFAVFLLPYQPDGTKIPEMLGMM